MRGGFQRGGSRGGRGGRGGFGGSGGFGFQGPPEQVIGAFSFTDLAE
jgi:hypothetical protein